ncbi:MAG: restriction endonuclease subunit S [Armatimonadota bacterium]
MNNSNNQETITCVCGWRKLSLREANVKLLDCDHRTPPSSASGYPYVLIPQLQNGRINISNTRRISSEHFIEWTRKTRPTAYDVVLSRRCNPGETAFVPAGLEFALGQNLVLLRTDGSSVYPPFLRWLVNGPEWWGQVRKFLNVGAIFDSLKCADIPNFELCIPPLSEQRTIAHILNTLDDKIELNRQMNETLEEIACAIFKSWFVDFDPVRAKAEGRDPGLPKNIADLFPDSFEDSEIGEIPKGWKTVPLWSIANFINGAAYRDFHFSMEPGALPIIKIAEIKNGVSGQTKFTRTELANKYRIDDGDILFSWSGNPDTSIDTFVWTGGPGWLNQHIYRVCPKSSEDRYSVYYLLCMLRPIFAEIARDKQTTGLGHVTAQDMKAMLVPKCTPAVLRSFNDYVGPLYEKRYANLLSSRNLIELRDLLLPKLISGEIPVNGAKIEAV